MALWGASNWLCQKPRADNCKPIRLAGNLTPKEEGTQHVWKVTTQRGRGWFAIDQATLHADVRLVANSMLLDKIDIQGGLNDFTNVVRFGARSGRGFSRVHKTVEFAPRDAIRRILLEQTDKTNNPAGRS